MADALVPVVVGAVEQVPAKVAYQPTSADWQLVEAFQQVISTSGRISNDGIGNHLKITGEAVRKRLAKPGCRDWVYQQLGAGVEAAWPALMARAFELAMRGSIDHMNFVAKVRGGFKQPDNQGGDGRPVSVHIHV